LLVGAVTVVLSLLVQGLVLVGLLGVAIDAVYVVGLMGRNGRTLGQAAMGLRVIRVHDHQPPGYDVVARRWLVIGSLSFINAISRGAPDLDAVLTPILGLVELLVLLWAVWDPNRQGLHDKFAGTLVINGSLAVPDEWGGDPETDRRDAD
jgi:uncharacterized RDD family membrane protein YckC